VAEQRQRVVAAAHLLRYGSGEEVGEAYRGTAEINWLLCWPRAMRWLDSGEAAGALVDVCLERLQSWGVTHWHADGGTRLSAHLDEEVVGFIEVETNLAEGGRLAHLGGWADVGNLHVVEAYRRRGVATWLFGQAPDWLRLARADRLLDYAWPEEEAELALLARLGFRELTRTARGWHHRPGPA
jgi:ribosomal protein S18 acetylase RimI-like enzyme